MAKYIAFVLTPTLCILFSGNALGLDAPHNAINDYGCESCHDVTSNLPKLMPPDLDTTQDDIDDTILNTMCWSCHNDSGDAPDVEIRTHSSLQTDEGYGEWTVECRTCHNPHKQEQENQTPANYGGFIRKTIDLSDIIYADGKLPKSGRKTVTFSGPDSFTDVDGTGEVTGICQVCHTETTHWKSDGSLAGIGVHTGLENSNCMSCHSHVGGFKAACDSCHGFPPGNLVSIPGATGSTTAGAHLEHTANQSFSCDACHFENLPNEVHNDGLPLSITIGFGPSGIAHGGSYDGQSGVPGVSGVQYDASSTVPVPTTVSSGGTKTCANLYCHGNFAGSGNNSSPIWDDPSTADCGSCHGSSSGGHSDHVTLMSFECSTCHYNTADGNGLTADKSYHVNYATDWRFDPTDPRTTGGIYNGTSAGSKSPPSTTYGSCSNLYCHGNFAGSGNNASPVWDDPSTANCGSCHGSSTGAHSDHITIMSFECSLCHYNTASGNGLAADKSHHVNYATDWRFDPTDNRTAGADYNTTNAGSKSPPSTTYSSCNNLYCHSTAQGTVDPTTPPTYRNPSWTDTLSNCQNCHNLGAHRDPPFMDSGSHYAHVQYRFTQPGNCQACHYLDKGGQLCTPCHTPHGSINSRTDKHVDGNIDVDFLPSLVGSSAAYNGDNVPRTAYANCDNTYCHSNGTSVSTGTIPLNATNNWGTPGPLACNACHEYGPTYSLYNPKANSHVRHDFLGCETCHYTTTTNGTTIANKTTHVNGQYDVSPSPTFFANGSDRTNTFDYVYDTGGGTCSNISCHTYWTFDNNKKWGGASLTPSSIGYNLTDQGNYGVTVYVGSPTCFPEPDSTTCPAPFTYIWEFSDGYIETTTTPSIHYEFGVPGPHTVTLTQIAANGLNGTRTSAPFTPLPPPPPTPQYNPQATLVGNTVTVTVVTDPPNPDIGKIDIWWDGTGNASGDDVYISFPATMQHTYSTPGTYTIRVRVTTDPDRDEYEYEWNTADCSNCPTLQVTVP